MARRVAAVLTSALLLAPATAGAEWAPMAVAVTPALDGVLARLATQTSERTQDTRVLRRRAVDSPRDTVIAVYPSATVGEADVVQWTREERLACGADPGVQVWSFTARGRGRAREWIIKRLATCLGARGPRTDGWRDVATDDVTARTLARGVLERLAR